MTSDLLTQLQEYGRQLDAEAMPLPSARAVPLSPPRRALLQRPWAVAGLAAIATLVLIGAATPLLRSEDTQVTDEPVTVPPTVESAVTTTSVVETPPTLAAVPQPTVTLHDTGRWQATKLSEPWTGDIVDVASLPSGGFVVAARPGVFWSPDGVEWIDADPQRQVATATPSYALGTVISVVGDQVAVLDRTNAGLWVGNPQAGAWTSIRLDTADPAGEVEPFAVASNDTEVLVVAVYRAEATSEGNERRSESAEGGYLVWLVNPRTGEVERHHLSPPTWPNPYAEELSLGPVEWVNDRWVMALADAILVSSDGATWTRVPDEDTFDDHLWVGTLTAGPTGVIATTCGGLGPHDVWFSEDGLKWEDTGVDAFHSEPAYADGLGFVVIPAGVSDGHDDQVMVSPDGRTWHATTMAEFAPQNLAGSGPTVLGDDGENAFLLTYE